MSNISAHTRKVNVNSFQRFLRIVCGPFVRYISHNSAVIWMEMNHACKVTVLLFKLKRLEQKIQAKTFQLGLRFYVMIPLERLLASTWYEYEVLAQSISDDSTITVWPIRNHTGPRPRSTFQTVPIRRGPNIRIVYVSCRKTRTKIEDKGEKRITEADALKIYAIRILSEYHLRQLRWPHLIIMMGDQVYADSLSTSMRNLISASHKAQGLPENVVLTLEEHAMLYNESWSDEDIRWLLSCIPSLMIFDDHEVIDDWNISEEWLKEKQSTDWWSSKLAAALSAYWIYQGAGNLSPSEWRSDERMKALIPPSYSHNRNVTSRMHSLFLGYATRTRKARWGYVRDLGSTRIIVANNRARRDLIDRKMMDDEEWNWFADSVRSSNLPNLLIIFSLPFLLPEGIHELESLSERSTQFPWSLDPLVVLTEAVSGKNIGRELRERPDLEHWPAFSKSFNSMLDLLEEVMSGQGTARRLLAILSGDVHFSYNMKGRLSKAPLRPIYQLVSSPASNRMSSSDENKIRLVCSPIPSVAIETVHAIAAANRSPTFPLLSFPTELPSPSSVGLRRFVFPTVTLPTELPSLTNLVRLPLSPLFPTFSFPTLSLQSAAQRKRIKWSPLNTNQDWIMFGNFVATLILFPGLMQCTYERADIVREGIQKKGDPYPGKLTKVLSFIENIT
jgi:hypothetical protein